MSYYRNIRINWYLYYETSYSDEVKEEAKKRKSHGIIFLKHEIHFRGNYCLADDSMLQAVHHIGLQIAVAAKIGICYL